MAEGEELDKSEAATPYKIKKAREKGQVARGMDLGFAGAIAMLCLMGYAGAERMGHALSQSMRHAFVSASSLSNPQSALEAGAQMFAGPVYLLVLLFAFVFAMVIVLELAQTGVVFSAAPLKPDFKKINPVTGLKRIFTAKQLFETLKNVLKLVIYTFVAWLVIRGQIVGPAKSATNADIMVGLLFSGALKLLFAFLGVAIFFAVADQLLSRRAFAKQMRMSRREVRREHRDREGEPRQKNKRKQMHREFVANAQSLQGIKSADVLIVNPSHYAVALRYRRHEIDAPVAVSLGADGFALRLKRLALLYRVTVIENPVLARGLYATSKRGKPVAEHFFPAIAEIYKQLPSDKDNKL